MDSFIKKIFNESVDDSVHQQFQKFSRGEFPDRAMIRIKNSKGKYTISTTAEYAKDLITNLAEKLKQEKTEVTGALISALDLDGFEYKEKKSAIGVRKYLIETEMSGEEILELTNKIQKAFFALSFKTNDSELKIKPKSPKSSKGASSKKKEGEKTKIDFCKLKTTDKSIIETLLLQDEPKDFKNMEIKHDLIIDEIIISEELKQEYKDDFAKIREMAKRKGKIIRKIIIDDKETKKEKEFII
ncbi:hypothetical protein HOE04_04945 [archaeon]|jgi:hypothetical protein|nr:hypothetical protein [archaeon]